MQGIVSHGVKAKYYLALLYYCINDILGYYDPNISLISNQMF